MNVSRAVLALVVASSLGGVGAMAQDDSTARAGGAALAAPPASCPDPVAMVAQFLHLAPEQVQALGQLLQARQAAQAPLLAAIVVREQRIRELVASGGDPSEIGRLMLEVHQLQMGVAAAQAEFLAGFNGALNEPQRAAWQQVRAAALLQPVLPPFQALRML